MILPWTGDELSRGQTGGWRTHTDTHTHRQTQATTIPEGQTWPRVKKGKMHAIKQIKICPEYRDMLPRPRLDFPGTTGSWQTSLGLSSMSRYSANIYDIYIIIEDIKNNACTMNNDFLVTSRVICQLFSPVTKSRVEIIGKSPHE